MHASPQSRSGPSWTRLAGLLAGSAVIFILGRASVQPRISLSGARTQEVSGEAAQAQASTSFAGQTRASENPITAEEWRRKLGAAPAAGPAGEKNRLQLLAAWAHVAPTDALDYVRTTFPLDRKQEALTVVFAAWAQTDPHAAWAWVRDKESGEAGRLHTVISEVAKNDATLAQTFARGYAAQHPDLASNAYFAVLDGVLYSGGYEAAKAIVASAAVPNEEQRSLLLNYLAGDWARYQPAEAAQWVLHLPESPARSQALNAVTQAWSDASPAGAAEFAVNLPAGPERQAALQQAISKWALSDPMQAGQWVLKYNAHGDFDQAVASIATSSELMNHNVPLALDWAGTIQQQDLRRRSTSSIIATWYSADPASALNYIKTSQDLSVDQRNDLLRSLPARN